MDTCIVEKFRILSRITLFLKQPGLRFEKRVNQNHEKIVCEKNQRFLKVQTHPVDPTVI